MCLNRWLVLLSDLICFVEDIILFSCQFGQVFWALFIFVSIFVFVVVCALFCVVYVLVCVLCVYDPILIHLTFLFVEDLLFVLNVIVHILGLLCQIYQIYIFGLSLQCNLTASEVLTQGQKDKLHNPETQQPPASKNNNNQQMPPIQDEITLRPLHLNRKIQIVPKTDNTPQGPKTKHNINSIIFPS